MEEEQFSPDASVDRFTSATRLKAYGPIHLDRRPEAHAVSRRNQGDASGRLRRGDGSASAACIADFIILDMVAEAASGSKTPKEAAERAQARRAYYKV